jgi:SAM-dependent methyltransferase
VTTTKVHVYDGSGTDVGYLRDRQGWWFDPTFPHAFEIFDVDGFYESNYFKADHVDGAVVDRYVTAVLEYGQRCARRPIRSVLELGCGGGWFTKEFFARGVDIVAVEGSRAGIARAREQGIPGERLIQHDLRRPITLGRTFDLAVCTEVAEHIECPLAGQLIQTIVDHAPIVWFSFEPPGTNEAHYHHCNEQPLKFWVNLFGFHGYRGVAVPAAICASLADRAGQIFFGPAIDAPAGLEVLSGGAPAGESLGAGRAVDSRIASGIKQVMPPIAMRLARRLFGRSGRRHGAG